MSRRLAVCALTAALLLSLGAPLSAFAATAPQAGGDLDVQAWTESGQLIIVTAVAVPEDVKLPATVRIPVPDGASVQWAGEVLGGDLSADPAREYKLVKSPAGGQYAEFTIEETRSAQVDAQMSAVTVDGATTTATFEWIQATASPLTSFALRVPPNAQNVKMTPSPSGAPDTNDIGERLYSSAPVKLEPGATQTVSLSFTAGTAPAAGAASDSGLNTLIVVLIVALAAAVVVLFAVIARERRSVSVTPEQSTGEHRPARRSERPSAVPAEKAADDSGAKSSPDDDWGFDDLD